jgi:ParB family chromosome partitioning protein
MSMIEIPLSRLVHSHSNVRKTGRSIGLEGLAASIAAHGLRQNLTVKLTTAGRYEVVAGGRRLAALKQLVKHGQLPREATVPCLIVAPEEEAKELSLVENAIRLDMHPDDQAQAFADLVRAGSSIDDIAVRFGTTSRTVAQRLRLAAVSPVLRELYRQGALETSQMMALALVDDHAVQEAAWNRLPDWNRQPEAIRRALTGEGLAGDHRFAKFVGIEAYRAAGGEVIEDLFEEDRAPVLVDANLVQILAAAKLEETATAVRFEGWSWVKVELTPDYVAYGRVYPVERDDETAGARPSYSDEDLARAGARVTLGYNGSVSVERGLVSPETIRADAQANTDVPPTRKGLSDAMVADLTAHRTAALRLALARDPRLGLAAAVHALLLGVFYGPTAPRCTCLDLCLRPMALSVVDPDECTAHYELETPLSDWRARLPPTPDAFWSWCVEQDQATLLKLLALATGLSVNAVSHQENASSPRLDHAGQLAHALKFDMKGYWRPKATSFFSRLTKALMSTFLSEIGARELADDVLKLSKSAAAERTAEKLIASGWQPSVFKAQIQADRPAHDEPPPAPHGDRCPVVAGGARGRPKSCDNWPSSACKNTVRFRYVRNPLCTV